MSRSTLAEPSFGADHLGNGNYPAAVSAALTPIQLIGGIALLSMRM